MGNLADIIEEFILHKLRNHGEDIIVLRRNELADELECAPSQISYVLSTRFTVDRGFLVESRRGSGGFVRIARIPIQHIIYEDAARQAGTISSLTEVEELISRLRDHGFLTGREAALINDFVALTFRHVADHERSRMLRALFQTLAQFTKEG